MDEATEAVAEAADHVHGEHCEGFGPQTPRNISMVYGENRVEFPMAPSSTEMNLCNIHTHTSAEHQGPGFNIPSPSADEPGFLCNDTADLSASEVAPLDGAFAGAEPGKTIEVHWVHTSCDAAPGEGLGACVPEGCEDPLLRVETQVFLVVNDEDAPSFMDYAYDRDSTGNHQPLALPSGTGEPVVFRGSTTGPSYDQMTCSPLHVTWSVRPQCQRVSAQSMIEWGADNPFAEVASHGVRELVVHPALLSPIE